MGIGICLFSWPVPGSGRSGRTSPCLPCSAAVMHCVRVRTTCSQSTQMCCLQGRLVLGEHEGGGWERTLARELLGSSSSRTLRLTLRGPLPQTLAGSTGESAWVLLRTLEACPYLRSAAQESCMVAMPADVMCDTCSSQVSGCLSIMVSGICAREGSRMVSELLCTTCTWVVDGQSCPFKLFCSRKTLSPWGACYKHSRDSGACCCAIP